MFDVEQKHPQVLPAPPRGHRKRVLFIAPQPFISDRGSPFRVRSTVTCLRDLGYEVHLLVLPLGKDVQITDVNIHRAYPIPGLKDIAIGPSLGKAAFDLSVLAKAAALVRARHFDVIHGVEEAGLIAWVLSRLSGCPYVYDMHSCMSVQMKHSKRLCWRLAEPLVSWLEQSCLRAAAGGITVGDDHTSRARVLAPDVPVISLQDLPLDCATGNNEELKERLRRELSLEGRRLLVYTGNFEKYQGLDLLFEAFARFQQQSGDRAGDKSRIALVLVGGGAENHPLMQHYRALAQRLGIQQTVVFAGQRAEDEMGAFMSLAEVLTAPRTEGDNTPLKIYSYMAAEKLILATRIRSNTQVLTEECAVLADPEPAALARGIEEAFDTSEAGRTAASCRVTAAKILLETFYSRSVFMKRLEGLYGEILGQSAPLAESVVTP